jgi:hypothetical protein
MADDVAALQKQFAIQRDADGMAGMMPLPKRCRRPAFDRANFCDLAGGHDDDLVAACEMTGLDAAGDDAAVVELVDRLHRQPQRQLFQRARRLELIDGADHGRAVVPAQPR